MLLNCMSQNLTMLGCLLGKDNRMYIDLQKHSRARIWYEDAPQFNMHIVEQISKEHELSLQSRCMVVSSQVAVELLIPNGGKFGYGLLGASFYRDSSNAGIVRFVVPISEANSDVVPDSIIRKLDVARVGLTKEYAVDVLADLESLEEGCLESGSLVITSAAYSDIGSSRNMFRRVAHIMLALMRETHLSEKSLISLMERKLEWQPSKESLLV